MRYGSQIGYKFNQDGTPKKYPGNTIIADIDSSNPAYPVITQMKQKIMEGKLGELFIFLPEDSYHVTIIRGMNDFVRKPGYWPPALSKDASMDDVDNFFEKMVSDVTAPKQIHMQFDQLKVDDCDVRICLKPWNQKQARELQAYRDQIADRINLHLPGHDSYTYHITLAYTLWIPEGDCRWEMEQRIKEINAFLEKQKDFWLSSPTIRFYDDMLKFHMHRIPRT